jgi:phosphatidylglycerophosphate synthase
MVEARVGRTAWAVPALLFLSIVFVAGLAFNLANLDPGQETVPVGDAGGTDPNSSSIVGLVPVLYAVTLAAGLLVVALLAYVLAHRRREKGPAVHVVRRNQLVRTLATLVLILLFILLWRQAAPADGDEPTDETPPGDGDSGFRVPPLPRLAGIPLVVFLAGALFAALLAVSYFVRASGILRRPPPAPEVHFPSRAAAASTVVEAIRRIERGDDVRAAILGCFARFCELLGARGVSDQGPLTPRELEDLAIGRLRVGRRDAEDLTGLFEEARYSVHPLGQPDRDRALRSLERIRTALEA